MDFTASSSQLHKQLSSASRILSARSNMVLQDNVLFTVRRSGGEGEEGGVLEMRVSDRALSFLVSMPVVSVRREGKIGVPHRILIDTLKGIGNIPVRFCVEPEMLEVRLEWGEGNSRGEFNISGCSKDDFPDFPTLNPDETLHVNTECETFLDLIGRTMFAASKDEAMRPLSGLLFEMSPSSLRVVTTDSNRIACLTRSDFSFSESRKAFLGLRAASAISSVITSDKSPLSVEFDNAYLRLTGENFLFVCRLAELAFPPYEQVLPYDNEDTLVVDRQGLLNSVRAMAPISDKGSNIVSLMLRANELEVSARSQVTSNHGFQMVPCTYSGAERTVLFATHFLTEILDTLSSPDVIITFSKERTISMIRPSVDRYEAEEMLCAVAQNAMGM